MTFINFDDQDPKRLIKSQRKQILEHFKHTCVYCNAKYSQMTIDHVVAIKYGGSERTSNKVCACSRCNLSKAHEPWLTWYRRQPFYNVATEAFINAWIDIGIRKAS